MPKHQEVIARRCIAIQGIINFPVSGIYADLQHPHKHTPAAGNITHRRLCKLCKVHTVRSTWTDSNGFHGN